MALEKATDYSERDKARGKTPAQKELRSYHEGDFQSTDPVTGEPRGKMAANWEDADNPPQPLDADAPDDLPDDDEESSPTPPARKAPARKAPARKATKRSRKVIGESPLRTDVE